jgi:hypothetical protein
MAPPDAERISFAPGNADEGAALFDRRGFARVPTAIAAHLFDARPGGGCASDAPALLL